VIPTRLLVLSMLLFVMLEGPARAQSGREGSWSARTRAGNTLKGSWTAAADPKTGTVTGTWTLDDAAGKTAMRGAWSAAKSTKGWSGEWRAIVSGRTGEYAGTWNASVELKPTSPFEDLFELAVKNIVSGNWRAGGQAGAWSIRAYERQGDSADRVRVQVICAHSTDSRSGRAVGRHPVLVAQSRPSQRFTNVVGQIRESADDCERPVRCVNSSTNEARMSEESHVNLCQSC